MCHYKVEVRLMLSWSAFRCCSKSSNMMRHLLPVCAWKTWGRTYHMILSFSIIFLSMCHPLQGRSGCTWLSWYYLDAALNNEVHSLNFEWTNQSHLTCMLPLVHLLLLSVTTEPSVLAALEEILHIIPDEYMHHAINCIIYWQSKHTCCITLEQRLVCIFTPLA